MFMTLCSAFRRRYPPRFTVVTAFLIFFSRHYSGIAGMVLKPWIWELHGCRQFYTNEDLISLQCLLSFICVMTEKCA
ncbi:hypothetical protein CC77DRAFT_202469 [Alternaria alternata]|uniref:Uncharacterized protein n=1 Tax=Alternaria alternata TaxID=5599 RepID=A0A177DID5_ALTAL|nr:hypothetical protein CC77DRAFT_202469 [Alternaria alternata]OAG18609.1 hypothetical protein CC77DRAFT_202469 [Alternaria alternata]